MSFYLFFSSLLLLFIFDIGKSIYLKEKHLNENSILLFAVTTISRWLPEQGHFFKLTKWSVTNVTRIIMLPIDENAKNKLNKWAIFRLNFQMSENKQSTHCWAKNFTSSSFELNAKLLSSSYFMDRFIFNRIENSCMIKCDLGKS